MYIQKYNQNKNVLDSARERISFLFDSFESIIVSISGGKDSTVTAHLALLEAKKRNRKIGIYFLDEEVVYDSTIKQVEYIMSMYPKNTNRLWLQIPFFLTNSSSLSESQLICWEEGKHKLWMHPKGLKNIINKPWKQEDEIHTSGYSWLDFYGTLDSFQNCYKNTAFIIGLRATESPNRWRTMVKNPVEVNNQKIFWGTKKKQNFNFYPIYDWNFHDVWKYIYDENLKYSKIYDYQFKKGMPIQEIRVSSLIHEKSFKSICELPEFEPQTFNRLNKRIKGMSFVQETGKDSKMFKVRKLPKNYKDWIEYKDFLLKTYPDESKKWIFEKRFSKHLSNNYVARQQCRQLVLNDYENNLPVDNKSDPRDRLIEYYRQVL